MARGHGRGRPKKVPIVTFGSSVGARTQAHELNSSAQVTPEHTMGFKEIGAGSNRSEQSRGPKKLDMSGSIVSKPDLTTQTSETGQMLVPAIVRNGTIDGGAISEEEEEPSDEPKEAAWTKLFTKNRATTNGMLLDYVPPILVNGQQVVQLNQEELDKELNKWSSSLITYFIGETPGINQCKDISCNSGQM